MTLSAANQLRWARPLRDGLPIASTASHWGALGGFVFDRSTGRPCLLGSQHVLAQNHRDGRVWQPAPCGMGGCECNVIARLVRGRRTIVKWNDHWYFVDAAIARIDDDLDWAWEGRIPAAGRARAGLRVRKTGPATGATEGVVVDEFHVDRVRIGGLEIEAPNQLLIQARTGQAKFSGDGDSGALVCDDEGRAVGLIWGAKDSGHAVAAPIGPVLSELGITFEMEAV